MILTKTLVGIYCASTLYEARLLSFLFCQLHISKNGILTGLVTREVSEEFYCLTSPGELARNIRGL